MGNFVKIRSWCFLSLLLVITLIISLYFGISQILSTSHDTTPLKASSSENPMQTSPISNELNFTFTWGPNSQKIVQGTFRLEVSIIFNEENLSMVIRANDDDYNGLDYIGLVFDTNQNGYIDYQDTSYALFADNTTMPSVLAPHGCLCFAYCRPEPSYQEVSFNSDKGYLFIIEFPCRDVYHEGWNPIHSLKKGYENRLHICFGEEGGYFERIFIEFSFFLEG